MLLESIKISGFKSFADRTIIDIRSHLNAIVGPNGCGKSNVVDAIRWVIGETSAKQLRSQSMADVIFNGTSKRSAANRAHVELTFDNHQGRLSGPFSDFDTIQIAREVTADGQSNYSINQRICRRKDILDLFSGTGMGSRSYSIIEQGMISRLIEAKPEELRIFLEEACGISKYKDRRKETQTRMRHCEENLERVTDICEELEKQHRKLSRQAKNAERYKVLSSEEYDLKHQLLAFKYQDLTATKEQLDTRLVEVQTQFESYKMDFSNCEEQHQTLLEAQKQANHDQHEQQRVLYEHQNKIQSIEQTLAHQKQERAWREEHLARADKAYAEYQAILADNTTQAESLQTTIEANGPRIIALTTDLRDIEQSVQTTKEQVAEKTQAWNAFVETQATLASKNDLFEQKLKHLDYLLQQARSRQSQLQEELDLINIAVLQEQAQVSEQAFLAAQSTQSGLDEQVEANAKTWQSLNAEQQTAQHHLAEAQTALQQANGRLASLEALQEAALHDDDAEVKAWLSALHLDQLSRLAQEMTVEEQWEQALEVVLADTMKGVCLSDQQITDFMASGAPKGSVTLLNPQGVKAAAQNALPYRTMADVIQTNYAFPVDLSTIYLAQDEAQAQTIMPQLSEQTSVILPDGRRFGRHWCQFTHTSDAQAGVLRRARELNSLKETIGELSERVAHCVEAKETIMQGLKACEADREALKAEYQAHRQVVAKALADKTSAQSQLDAKTQRHQSIVDQLAALQEQITDHQTNITSCATSQEETTGSLEKLEAKRDHLLAEKETVEQALTSLLHQQAAKRDEYQHLEMAQIRQQDQLKSLQEMIEKNNADIVRVMETRSELINATQQGDNSQELSDMLAQHKADFAAQESVVQAVKQQLYEVDTQLKNATQTKHHLAQQMESYNEQVATLRLDLQSCLVKQSGILEQYEQFAQEEADAQARAVEADQILAQETVLMDDAVEGNQAQSSMRSEISSEELVLEEEMVDAVSEPEPEIDPEVEAERLRVLREMAQNTLDYWLNHLPEDMNTESCAQALSDVSRRIAQLGPINLAAIEECEEIASRKEELDRQQLDLQEALSTLRDAIADLDKECQATLMMTYEQVNARFQEIFPSVFGGGKAHLELMSDDILSTGILVRAQPPGKRVATIHMLSGGEKALTAISLVFALFSLNPAPFCILDEVDAPLDDLNVERYCKLIEKMAKETQFMVISHNKTTIAHMDHLIGVTMGEPGVSRIVSVDMEEAVAMLD